MPKKLGKDISLIDLPTDVKELNDIRSNRFTNAMVGQGIMAFVEGGMRNGATGDDTLVVSKHIGLVIKRNSHHSKSITKVHNLFSGNVSSNELGTIGSSFNSLLTFGESFHRILVDKMKDSCTGPSSSEVMHDEISIFKGSSANRIASWSRHVKRKFLIRVTIDTGGPIKDDMIQVRIVRDSGPESDSSIRILP
jgi:hypothetical protein